MISTKVHGILDYLMGIVLILLPFLFDFPEGAATVLPIVLGAGTIVYSLMTNYEYGLMKLIPMKTHLSIDLMAGLLLLLAPWLFGFAGEVLWPFVVLGLFEIVASVMTTRYKNTDGSVTSNY